MNEREGEYNFTSQHVNFMVLTVKEIPRDMVLPNLTMQNRRGI